MQKEQSRAILLSQQLMDITSANLPLEIATQRTRLIRRTQPSSTLDNLLTHWAGVLERERAAGDSKSAQSQPSSTDKAKREQLSKQVHVALSDLARRLLNERPPLHNHGDILSYLAIKQPYVSDPMPYSSFDPMSEKENPEYQEILRKARLEAVEKGHQTFRFTGHNTIRMTYGALVFLGLGMIITALARHWTNVGNQDALILIGLNVVICGGLVRLQLFKKEKEQLKNHIQGAIEEEEREARLHIQRNERERLDSFLQEAKDLRVTFDTQDTQRRASFEKAEQQRLAIYTRLKAGKDGEPVMNALLPLKLPIPAMSKFSWGSEGRLEVVVYLNESLFLPPSVDGKLRVRATASTPTDKDIAQDFFDIGAALAIRHLSEVFFHLPSLRVARVMVARSADGTGAKSSPMIQVEAPRRAILTLRGDDTASDVLRNLRHRVFTENLPVNPVNRAA